MRTAWGLVAVAACGRLGFEAPRAPVDAAGDTITTGDGAATDGAGIDATPVACLDAPCGNGTFVTFQRVPGLRQLQPVEP